MRNLHIANLCYKVVEEMMKYVNRKLEYDEVPQEVRDCFEQDYAISDEVIVFWLKEQGELEEKVMSYKKTCQGYLKELSYNEMEEFITEKSNAYDFLEDIVDGVTPGVKELIQGLAVAQRLKRAK